MDSFPQPDKNGHARRRRSDDLKFTPSLEPTLGVELELLILDRESGDLSPGAVRVLKACAEESLTNVSSELMQSMVEVRTGICRDVGEVQQTLLPLLRRVRNIAGSMGYDLALAGTHPFHRTTGSTVFPSERYERILNRLAWITYSRVVFGLHVHVGVPSGDLALGVISMLVKYLPHLLAVSANSPFWQGVDTGLASTRTALYRLLPHAGVPRYFSKWKDFRNFCQVMQDCKAMASFKDIYWDIRPRPDFGTIEFRICDTPASLAVMLALVALTRSLVISSLRLLAEKPHLRRGDIRTHWIAVENKWLATRYGLGAMYVRTPAGKRRPLQQDLAELLEKMLPIARESGDHRFLAPLLPLAQFESGSDRQRRIYRQEGNWKAVTDSLAGSLDDELKVSRDTEKVAVS